MNIVKLTELYLQGKKAQLKLRERFVDQSERSMTVSLSSRQLTEALKLYGGNRVINPEFAIPHIIKKVINPAPIVTWVGECNGKYNVKIKYLTNERV
jgi:hypothetical protein